jgi:esterase/lipase
MEIKKSTARLDKKKIIILLPGWDSPNYIFNRIKKEIPKTYGYIYYQYSKEILNSDPFKTRDNFYKVIESIEKDIKKLKKKKPRDFYIYAQSLGTDFAVIVADKIKIKKIALILPGDNLAESFWKGIKTRPLKKIMEKNGINLKKLKKEWMQISPDAFFKKNGTKPEYYVIVSNKDHIIPYKNEKNLIKLMKEREIKVHTKISHIRHIPTIIMESIFPKATLDFLLK